MKTCKLVMFITILLIANSCKKTEFLDKKPSTDLIVPKTLNDFQALLDNTNIMNFTGGLAQLSSDEYMVPYTNYQSIKSITQRNAHIWAKDIYGGELEIADWNRLYTIIFYANAVLEGLDKSEENNSPQAQYLKGWALFVRSFSFYDLIRNFCKAYDKESAGTDLGIPLRLKAGIDYFEQRTNLQHCFDQVLNDLAIAENLLPATRPSTNLNRPSKIAVYALLSRIYLDMRNYAQAEVYAEKCLNLYDVLIDYKTVSKTSTTPFSTTNDELIYNTFQVVAYGEFTGTYTSALAKATPDLLALYEPNDLRLPLYFDKRPDNTYTKKRGYIGTGSYPFTGLATDEVYLVKAECLARKGQFVLAMDVLNDLVSKRWSANETIPAKPYENLTAVSGEDALQKVLLERRKELVWRGLRWHDLKRLNKEGANITLSRTLNGVTYTLPPNDPRWIFPIPDDEIALSGIEQNLR